MRSDSITIQEMHSVESKILVRFGLKQAGLLIAFYLLCISIGVVTNKTLEMAIFMFSTYTIRIYVGGFHANSKLNCLLISVALVFVGFLSLSVFNHIPTLSNGVVLLTQLLIFKFAPLQDCHKPLSVNEKIVFHRYSLHITSFWLILYAVALCNEWTMITSGVAASYFIISIILLAGIIKNQIVRIKI